MSDHRREFPLRPSVAKYSGKGRLTKLRTRLSCDHFKLTEPDEPLGTLYPCSKCYWRKPNAKEFPTGPDEPGTQGIHKDRIRDLKAMIANYRDGMQRTDKGDGYRAICREGYERLSRKLQILEPHSNRGNNL